MVWLAGLLRFWAAFTTRRPLGGLSGRAGGRGRKGWIQCTGEAAEPHVRLDGSIPSRPTTFADSSVVRATGRWQDHHPVGRWFDSISANYALGVPKGSWGRQAEVALGRAPDLRVRSCWFDSNPLHHGGSGRKRLGPRQGQVAQMQERRSKIPEVGGSSPPLPTGEPRSWYDTSRVVVTLSGSIAQTARALWVMTTGAASSSLAAPSTLCVGPWKGAEE